MSYLVDIGAFIEGGILLAENELGVERFGGNIAKEEFIKGRIYALRQLKLVVKEYTDKLDYEEQGGWVSVEKIKPLIDVWNSQGFAYKIESDFANNPIYNAIRQTLDNYGQFKPLPSAPKVKGEGG